MVPNDTARGKIPFYDFSPFSEKETIHKIWRLVSFAVFSAEVRSLISLLESKEIKGFLTTKLKVNFTFSIVELKY